MFEVKIDDSQVRRVFMMYPEQSVRRLVSLIEGAAIDTQAEMRRNVDVGATGEARNSIHYTMNPSQLSATIAPTVKYAEYLEKGTMPHWVSATPGSPLNRWANMKGLNPWAVQRSIAKKGTKAHPFVEPTYRTMQPRVVRDVVSGFGRFIQEVDNGNI